MLRAQQEEDFLIARGRLREIPDFLTAVPPDAAVVAEELQAAEAARRREYDRLLEELAADATATARVLAEASAAVGGTGRRGDSSRVVAYLAAQLPGWGDAELRRRGAGLAEAMAGLLTPASRESLAREAVALAGSAAFAGAFLAGLGTYGVRELLTLLGDGELGPASALARVLASALGAAVPTGGAHDIVGEVLIATYVDPDDVGTYPDLVALGIGVVLRAGGPAGPRPETVVSWGRQLLARERVQGQGFTGPRAVDRAAPIGEAHAPADPMEILLERLIRDDDARFAATFLAERSDWDVLLARRWDDGGAALSRLVAHAGTAQGAAGDDMARAGLEALGAGLADGDPEDWTVGRDTAAVIAPALGGAVAAHLSPVIGVLGSAADGEVAERDGNVLRGLGYLTLDAGAARAVQEGLQAWAASQSALGETGASQVGALPSAFVATQEYGQRLAYALHGFEQQAAAELKESRWDWTWGLVPNLVRRAGPGVAAGVVSDYAAIGLGRDGTWTNGPDGGLVFDARDTEDPAAFQRTLEALGRPEPPTSPPKDWLAPLKQAVVDVATDQISDVAKRRMDALPEGSSPGLGLRFARLAQ